MPGIKPEDFARLWDCTDDMPGIGPKYKSLNLFIAQLKDGRWMSFIHQDGKTVAHEISATDAVIVQSVYGKEVTLP